MRSFAEQSVFASSILSFMFNHCFSIATEATTEATTEAKTEATTKSTTEVTTEATTEGTTKAKTEATTKSTTEATTKSTTVSNLSESLLNWYRKAHGAGRLRRELDNKAVEATNAVCQFGFGKIGILFPKIVLSYFEKKLLQ